MTAPGCGTPAGFVHLRTPQRTVWGRFAGGLGRNPRLSGLDARHALWGLPSRLVRSALPSVAWGSACPPAARAPRFAWAPSGRPGGRPAATLAGKPALSSVGWPHLRSALTATTSRPLRCAACPCRVGVRLTALPARSCRSVSVSPRPRLGGACKAGGARLGRLPTGLRPRSGSGAGAP